MAVNIVADDLQYLDEKYIVKTDLINSSSPGNFQPLKW